MVQHRQVLAEREHRVAEERVVLAVGAARAREA
jgi:hypothetical protein